MSPLAAFNAYSVPLQSPMKTRPRETEGWEATVSRSARVQSNRRLRTESGLIRVSFATPVISRLPQYFDQASPACSSGGSGGRGTGGRQIGTVPGRSTASRADASRDTASPYTATRERRMTNTLVERIARFCDGETIRARKSLHRRA